jgi:hypothetical protein
MVKNEKSLKESSKTLGISIEEMQAYLDCESMEKTLFNDIVRKLDLIEIIEIPRKPNAITPAAFQYLRSQEKSIEASQTLIEALQKIIAIKEKSIKEKQDLLIDQLDKMLKLYVVIEKFVPQMWKEYKMEENYLFIRKYLEDSRGYSF